MGGRSSCPSCIKDLKMILVASLVGVRYHEDRNRDLSRETLIRGPMYICADEVKSQYNKFNILKYNSIQLLCNIGFISFFKFFINW